MRLRQIFEDQAQDVAIIFGRFNPPHKGHKEAWLTAANKDIWYVGTNSSTIGPTDPLPFEVKLEAMKTILPEVGEHIVTEQDWFTLATYVYNTHGKVNLYCVTDEAWVVPALQKSNGRKDRHGFYDFPLVRLYHDSIDEAKLALRKSSATSLREAVKLGDRQKFTDAAGVSSETPVMGKPFFDLVAEYLLPYADKEKDKKNQSAKKDSKKSKSKDEPKKETKPKKEKEDMKMKDVAEGIYGRSSSYGYNPDRDAEREWDAYQRGEQDFRNRERNAGLEDEDDPDFERKFRQQQIDRDRGPWYLKINGKILKKDGEPKVFDWKKGANNYGLAIVKNRPELQGKIFLTKKAEDDNG